MAIPKWAKDLPYTAEHLARGVGSSPTAVLGFKRSGRARSSAPERQDRIKIAESVQELPVGSLAKRQRLNTPSRRKGHRSRRNELEKSCTQRR